jgi:hypothetical protein
MWRAAAAADAIHRPGTMTMEERGEVLAAALWPMGSGVWRRPEDGFEVVHEIDHLLPKN